MNIYKDRSLSLKAKGIYFMIKTLNEAGEKVTRQRIESMTCTGSKSISTGINELKVKGYLEIKKINEAGTFRYEYNLLK
ncbi:MAG: hypothetical protein ACRCX8_08230 [Sarcina sp.]